MSPRNHTHLVAICIQFQASWVSARWHYTSPCFEGVDPLSEDIVPDLCQHRDGSTYTGTGPMHCLYRGKSRGLGRVLSPYIAVVDPGFPVGGHGPLTRALFSENVCKNERIGSHRGWCVPGTPPRSANV